jgi:hypothetical protein
MQGSIHHSHDLKKNLAHFTSDLDSSLHLNTDPDPSNFNEDPDPDLAPHLSDGNLQPLVYRTSTASF